MRIACWITKVANTPSEYVILFATPRQQWLHERASMFVIRTYPLFISVFNQLDAQNLFHNKFHFMPLHVSSTCAHHQEVKITLHSLWYHHTRWWAHMLETCRGMKWNLLWNKFCASSWLNTEINILRFTVNKTSKYPLLFVMLQGGSGGGHSNEVTYLRCLLPIILLYSPESWKWLLFIIKRFYTATVNKSGFWNVRMSILSNLHIYK